MPTRIPLCLALLLLATTAVAISGDAVAQRLDAGHERGDRKGRDARVERADGRGHHDRGADQRALSAAVRRVESQTGGQVLSAERVPFDGRDVSRVKVVDTNGRVRIYMDDPQAARYRPAPVPAPGRTQNDDN